VQAHTPRVISRKRAHVRQRTHLQATTASQSAMLVLEDFGGSCRDRFTQGYDHDRLTTSEKENPRQQSMSQLDGCLRALSASRMLSIHLAKTNMENDDDTIAKGYVRKSYYQCMMWTPSSECPTNQLVHRQPNNLVQKRDNGVCVRGYP
jgi:hypothetical protein